MLNGTCVVMEKQKSRRELGEGTSVRLALARDGAEIAARAFSLL